MSQYVSLLLLRKIPFLANNNYRHSKTLSILGTKITRGDISPVSVYESHRCDVQPYLSDPIHLWIIPSQSASTRNLHLRAANLRNPLRGACDVYFPEYIHHENVYLCILPPLPPARLHIHILLPYVTPAGVTLTVGPTVYVRKGYFIMRAERSGHIFPVYTPLPVCGIPSRQKGPGPL